MVQHVELLPGGADHFVVDSPFLFQVRSRGVAGNAEVADFAADFFIGVVWVEQCVEQAFELLIEDRRAALGVEGIAGAPLHGERGESGKGHGFGFGEHAAFIALADEEVFLGVRFALIRGGIGIDVGEGLRHGLELDKVEGEAGLDVAEAGAEGPVGGVEIECNGAEAADGRAFREAAESGSGRLVVEAATRRAQRPGGRIELILALWVWTCSFGSGLGRGAFLKKEANLCMVVHFCAVGVCEPSPVGETRRKLHSAPGPVSALKTEPNCRRGVTVRVSAGLCRAAVVRLCAALCILWAKKDNENIKRHKVTRLVHGYWGEGPGAGLTKPNERGEGLGLGREQGLISTPGSNAPAFLAGPKEIAA